MRKNDVRKWIHAVLDMLPLVVIPVFMVYSHRHTIDSYSVQAEETKVVDLNQHAILRQSVTTSVYSYVNNGDRSIDVDVFNPQQVDSNYIWLSEPMELKRDGSIYLFYANQSIDFGFSGYGILSNGLNYFTWSDTADSSWNGAVSIYDNVAITITNFRFNVVDLTQMFGAGNEPTYNQFIQWFPFESYPFIDSQHVLLKTGNYITYDDTDIGSQFFYSLYNTVDNYFNFGNVLNFGNIYDWLNVNIFNGSAPLSVYVVWNVFLYEFLMDLIFLLYALFMFFIDMCTNLIERFTCSASGGRLR